ncbi:MAG: Uma2 family endonuclease [Hormoscilla sp. GUM202]|nr:Uma2 family endonuclease [Hormoscilla sp. GUM202]
MYDLPSEDPDEIYIGDEYHSLQSILLRYTFRPSTYPRDRMFVSTNLYIYYDIRNLNWYKRPDWFAVVGVERLYDGHDMRDSYVMWQELVSPFVIVELLSPSTENEDLGRTLRQAGNPPTKWEVYEQILRVPYYIVFSRYTNELQTFHLVGGRYEPAPLSNGRLLIPQLELSLGLWRGSYEGIDRLWLRWFTIDGELILTPDEKAAAAQQEAAAAKQEAAAAKQEAERLAAKLRELNIDLDSLG